MMKFANNYFIYLPVYQLFNGHFIRFIYYKSITKSDEEPFVVPGYTCAR